VLAQPFDLNNRYSIKGMSVAVVGASGAVGGALARRLSARGTTPWLIGR